MNNVSRMWLVGGAWFATVAVILACSVAMDAKLSTSALLFVMCAMPLAVALLIGFGAPPPTVAELLHSVHNEGGR